MRCLPPKSSSCRSGGGGSENSDDSDNDEGSSSGSAAAQPTPLGMCLDCAAVSVVHRAKAAVAAAASSVAAGSAAAAARSATTTTETCPNDHVLALYVVPEPHCTYDGCDDTLGVGERVLSCRLCDYDLCAECVEVPDSESEIEAYSESQSEGEESTFFTSGNGKDEEVFPMSWLVRRHADRDTSTSLTTKSLLASSSSSLPSAASSSSSLSSTPSSLSATGATASAGQAAPARGSPPLLPLPLAATAQAEVAVYEGPASCAARLGTLHLPPGAAVAVVATAAQTPGGWAKLHPAAAAAKLNATTTYNSSMSDHGDNNRPFQGSALSASSSSS